MKNKLHIIRHRAVSGVWLLGEDFEHTIISEETYKWLWRNIYNICDNPRLIKMFWANSSQYFNLKLQNIQEEFKDNDYSNPTNLELIEFRKTERNRFLEFHFALGGLLLYRNQFDTIKYLFEFTQSEPPKYVLLPDNMEEIFN